MFMMTSPPLGTSIPQLLNFGASPVFWNSILIYCFGSIRDALIVKNCCYGVDVGVVVQLPALVTISGGCCAMFNKTMVYHFHSIIQVEYGR